jgi:hypothetical protein
MFQIRTSWDPMACKPLLHAPALCRILCLPSYHERGFTQGTKRPDSTLEVVCARGWLVFSSPR